MPDFIEPDILLKTKTLICKTQNANLKTNLILETALRLECKFLPTVCVTCGWAGVDKAWEQEKLEARKMLENATESHP